jgi:hypothetical protein
MLARAYLKPPGDFFRIIAVIAPHFAHVRNRQPFAGQCGAIVLDSHDAQQTGSGQPWAMAIPRQAGDGGRAAAGRG